MECTLTPEIRIEGDHRIEIEADFSCGWTIWIWSIATKGLLAHREVNWHQQIEQTLALMRAELGESPKFGVWDSQQGRFITYPKDTRAEADDALTYWRFEYRADGEDASVLSVKEIGQAGS